MTELQELVAKVQKEGEAHAFEFRKLFDNSKTPVERAAMVAGFAIVLGEIIADTTSNKEEALLGLKRCATAIGCAMLNRRFGTGDTEPPVVLN